MNVRCALRKKLLRGIKFHPDCMFPVVILMMLLVHELRCGASRSRDQKYQNILCFTMILKGLAVRSVLFSVNAFNVYASLFL